MDISVTERSIWRRCRRQWDLSSYNRQSLTRIDTVPTQFSIGTALHLAFGAHASGLDPREVVQEWLLQEEDRILGKSLAREGNQDLVERLTGARNLALDLIQHYYDYWGWDNPLDRQDLVYLAAEVPLRASIPGTEEGHLVGTIDGVAINRTTGGIWLVEHKTYAQRPSRADMDVNDQMTAYMWLFEQVFGFLPEGVIYDGVGKKLPAKPKLLVNGTMSRQWVNTTAAVYTRSLIDAGLDPADYVDFIARLEDQDGQEQNPFFTRWQIYISPNSVRSFEMYLPTEYLDMDEANKRFPPGTPVMESIGYLYPNFRWDGCWDCGVKDLCRAIQFHEDFEFIRDTFYVLGGGHETVRAKKIMKGDLESVHQLREHVPNVLLQMGYNI